MNGVHVHVGSEDGKTKGVLFQVVIGREAQGLVDMRNALNHLAEKNGVTDRGPDPLGIFVADETIDGLDPERGLALLWSQIVEEQKNRKGHEECVEGDYASEA